MTLQFSGDNSLLALQAAGSVSVSNAATPCFSQLFAVGSTCQFSVSSAGALTTPSVTDSGLSSGQLVKASTGGLLVNAGAIAGSGAGFTTGPTTATNGDLASFTGTGGQIADSGIATSNLYSLGGTLSSGNITALTGAGTSPTIAISGTDANHQITVLAGASAGGSIGIYSLAFTSSRGHTPYCTVAPANVSAVQKLSSIYFSVNSATGYTLSIWDDNLVNGVSYVWNINCP
ncbi:MAG TPA: hypothetical protein VGN16_15230 [Acidobacteriaceae bacterium]